MRDAAPIEIIPLQLSDADKDFVAAMQRSRKLCSDWALRETLKLIRSFEEKK